VDETEKKEDDEDDLQLDRDELEDCLKTPAAVKEEEKDETEEKDDLDERIESVEYETPKFLPNKMIRSANCAFFVRSKVTTCTPNAAILTVS
jgi:hypothetical protein